MPQHPDMAAVAGVYREALKIIGKLVDSARKGGDLLAALGAIEDILDVVSDDFHPTTAAEVLADLGKLGEALASNDAVADQALHDKFGVTDNKDT